MNIFERRAYLLERANARCTAEADIRRRFLKTRGGYFDTFTKAVVPKESRDEVMEAYREMADEHVAERWGVELRRSSKPAPVDYYDRLAPRRDPLERYMDFGL
jgi:hypothetical protein